MKLTDISWIGITSFLLIVLIFGQASNLGTTFLFLIFFLGQISLLIMVYKVLTADYDTKRSFDDFYEDKDVD